MPQCSNCGAQAPSQVIYCPACGARITHTQDQVAADVAAQISSEKEDRYHRLALRLLGLALLAFVVGMVFSRWPTTYPSYEFTPSFLPPPGEVSRVESLGDDRFAFPRPTHTDRLEMPPFRAAQRSLLIDRTLRSTLAPLHGGSEATEQAVDRGLEFLKRMQWTNGRWNARAGPRNEELGAARDWETVATAYCLLAFMGAGYGPSPAEDAAEPARAYGQAVRDGLNYLAELALLASRESPGGGMIQSGPENEWAMLGHALGTLALSEGVAMGAEEPATTALPQAIDFLLSHQSQRGNGWSRGLTGPTATTVTACAVMALGTASRLGQIPPERLEESFTGAKRWLDQVTNARGLVGEMNDRDHPLGGLNCTAAGTIARMLIAGRGEENFLPQSLQFLRQEGNRPVWPADPAQGGDRVNLEYCFFGSLVMFQAGGADWDDWNRAVVQALTPRQETADIFAGSWPPVGASARARAGLGYGRLIGTALGVLTLETYYRFPPLD